MKKLVPFLIYPAIGLVAGWASVGLDFKPEDTLIKESSSSRRAGRERPTSAPIPSSSDLLKKTREGLQSTWSMTDALADWTEAEIIDALNEALGQPDDFNVGSRILKEYVKRNPEGALEWAKAQSAPARAKLMSSVLNSWPRERVDDALKIARENPDVFGRNLPMFLVQKSIAFAAVGGPQAVIDRLHAMSEDGFNRHVTFPSIDEPGFDYRGLLSSPEFQSMGLDSMQSSLIHAWMKKDRESAFQWMIEGQGAGSISKLRPPAWETTPAKSLELTRWMMGKIEALPPEQQDEFIRKNAFTQPDSDAQMWIESAKNPELRDAIRVAAAQGVFMGPELYTDHGLQALATLPDGESRLRALEDLISKRTAGPVYQAAEGREKLIRTRLADWGADPQRVDSILKQMKDKETKVTP